MPIPLTFMDPGANRVDIDDRMRTIPLPSRAGLKETLTTARHLERIGFRRYWVGEHHVEGNFHSTPEILVALLAQETKTLRVGTAGVLLPYTRPYKAAEYFRALGAWFPGRIDMGFAKGPGATERARPFLLRESGFAPEAFRQDMEDLLSYVGQDHGMPLSPKDAVDVQAWCHSSNPETWRFAAERGMGIGIALFLQQDKTAEMLRDVGRRVEEHYLPHFRPGSLKEPSVVSVDSVFCLDDPRVIDGLRQMRGGGPWGTATMGSPRECWEHAQRVVELTRATEFGVFQTPHMPAAVRKSCALLAAEAGYRDLVHAA
jgi:luciferase family oxidoreductase group 1